MTDKSPAQAGYEAYAAAIGMPTEPWEALDPVAQAAIAACVEAGAHQLSEVLARVTERLENLAAGMMTSAAATSPSRKSEIERGCAQAVSEIVRRELSGIGDN